MVSLSRLTRPTNLLVDQAVEHIRGIIERDRLRPGDRLPTETEFGEQLGVSRSVIREAMSRLAYSGLVVIQRGRGTFVCEQAGVESYAKLIRTAMALSPKELAKFTEFRTAIECYAARRAAESATEDDIAELEKLCLDIDRKGRSEMETMRVDFQFHCRLMTITGNELMCKILEVTQEFVLAAMVKTTGRPRNWKANRSRHMAIVNAIRAHDPDAAEEAMLRHMEFTQGVLKDIEQPTKARTRA